MFTVDTSTVIAFFDGQTGPDTELFEEILSEESIILTPPVISEILSDPALPQRHEDAILAMPCVHIAQDFWQRAGRLRRKVLHAKLKARLADTLIVQCCLDHNLTLIARDGDFKNFAKHSRLKIFSSN